MTKPGENAPRPTADEPEEGARRDVNPDLHGQAREAEEKMRSDDPDATPGGG
ncbi:hypothetical protein [Actinomycetospora lemnae]|uniref:Nucleotide exchange factor GrpE n=1 Tax=Actinomycetospora lemnae TaxID=3019891 RepID=A0ABT5SXT9_9PSEU|nr:hypothetical protein [Actinomycetospora sp. DW7H6]MDD7967677.1 hypothetical protein [Actinomycetospora sp. DW7H6]